MSINKFKDKVKQEIKNYEELVIPSLDKSDKLNKNESIVAIIFNWNLTRNQVAELLHSINDAILNVYEVKDKYALCAILYNGDLTEYDKLEAELIRLKLNEN